MLIFNGIKGRIPDTFDKMSAMSPELYNFVKKLEENGDKLAPLSPQRDQNDCAYNNSTCSQCNGYYGPNFGEPVCVTCHVFLFPDFPSYLPTSYFLSENLDDGDSGNDEPSDLNFSSERKISKMNIPALFYFRNSVDSETSPEDEGSRASNSGEGPSGSGRVGGQRGEMGNQHREMENQREEMGNLCGEMEDQHGEMGDMFGHVQPQQPSSLARSLQALSTARPPDNLPPGLVQQLPSEVVLCILSYLDDLSLCACAGVCARWRRLVRAHVPPHRWAAFAARRWPLFAPQTPCDWHKKYEALVQSMFCRHCVVQMCALAQPAGDENAWRRNRLRMERKMLRNDPPEGIAATPLDANCCHWQASVAGPAGSPYEGGLFYLYIQVPYSYPMSPPVVRFLTRILHPNVSRHGDVGIDSVHHNWSLALTLAKVLISIQSLLTDPYTAVCMEPAIGQMYVQSRAQFDDLARDWTWRYAMHDLLP